MAYEEEKLARAALRTIPGLGSGRLRQLIHHFGSALKAWQAPAQDYAGWGTTVWVQELLKQQKIIDLEAIKEKMDRLGIKLVVPGEGEYPSLLSGCMTLPPCFTIGGKAGRTGKRRL